VQWVCALYCLTGCAGLIYETVWIRQFALSFGSTTLSFSTVISVFVGGLALGALWGERMPSSRGLKLYGIAEIWIGVYALGIPRLMSLAPKILSPLYTHPDHGLTEVSVARASLCALILLPATIPMGAGLPWLGAALRREGTTERRLAWIYAINTAGAAAGALLTGLLLLPKLGYGSTLITASTADVIAGLAALWLSRVPLTTVARPARQAAKFLSGKLIVTAVCSGISVMIYEVAANRIAGLMFGPTAATVTMTLAVVLTGLAAGAVLASMIRSRIGWWLALSQLAAVALLLGASMSIAASPEWLAAQIRLIGNSALRTELLEARLLLIVLLPLTVAAGMAFPLAIRLLDESPGSEASIGRLYAVNAAGSIAGSLGAGWVLIPLLGSERTLYAGAAISLLIAVAVAAGDAVERWRWVSVTLGVVLAFFLWSPRWDMAAMTSGAYKYAPYYKGDPSGELHNGEIAFLKEGRAGTVTVRRVNQSLVLAIDGKVDATDSGGDLLSEKLLAHLPLGLVRNPQNICVIGLASGVSAGAVLTYPVARVDLLEVSPEVVQASHYFDAVNGKPLSSPKARLIVNDGRNHLALTNENYDLILSEPSNPWISGMNSMFTKEFFQIARKRLTPGGVLAQWFHLYNMPPDDLRTLLRAFTQVFPSSILWQLNEGDVLLTGFADDLFPAGVSRNLSAASAADLAAAGVSDPALLSTLYVMHGQDLVRFAGIAEPNTDDRPILEFHGQQDMQLQTDQANMQELKALAKQEPAPGGVQEVRNHMTPERLEAAGMMFEKAESYELAFQNFHNALVALPGDSVAMAGVIRNARTPEDQAIAGTLESRTTEALESARKGDVDSAERMLRVLVEAYPTRPEPHFNLGLFCIERNRYAAAIENFEAAIHTDPRFLPAFEAVAETYLREADLQNAAAASRRILQLDPTHAVAKQTLMRIERQLAGRS
jgi:spermidine synthase